MKLKRMLGLCRKRLTSKGNISIFIKGDIVGLFEGMIERFRKLPSPHVLAVVGGKLVFGLGFGMILARCFQNYLDDSNWYIIGLGLIIVSLIMHIPGFYGVFKK